MSGMFNSKKTTPEVSSIADPYGGVRNSLTSWLQSQVGQPAQQYGGEMAAPLSGQEKQSFDYLNKYINQGTPQGTSLANEEVRKTMQGEYDPTSSPYYQAVKAEAARNLEDTQSQISDQAAGGGRYWTGARLGAQANALTDYGLGLNKTLYGMAENERQNRLNTAPFAAQLGQQERDQPLGQARALQGLGGLERNVNQSRDEAVYNEWVNANRNYPMQIGQMASGVQQAPLYAQSGYSPSIFSQIAPLLGSAASTLLGPAGTAAGGALGSWLSGILGGSPGGGTSKISDYSSSKLPSLGGF